MFVSELGRGARDGAGAAGPRGVLAGRRVPRRTGMDVVTLLADRLRLHDAMRAPQHRSTDDDNEVRPATRRALLSAAPGRLMIQTTTNTLD